jgi:acetyl esterase/lipase
MNSCSRSRRLAAALACLVLLGGCAGGTTPVPTAGPAAVAPASPAVVAATPTATRASRPTAGSLAVLTTTDVAYESTNTLLEPGKLDVYTPSAAGPWPVVMMFHGQPVRKDYLAEHAQRVAALGFVVFVPEWGQPLVGNSADAPTYELMMADTAQGACAVAFARSRAAAYGGDPATMIVFGHSAGASVASMVAFARPAPTPGCLGGSVLGAIDALVTWEGMFLLAWPGFDPVLAADRRAMNAWAPWAYLAAHRDLRTVMLVSENPGADYQTPLADATATNAFFALRDPSGDLRRRLQGMGALADHAISVAEEQQLLFAVLKAQGNPVSLDVMPGSAHESLSDAGWMVFLDAFRKAVAHT